MHKIKQLLCDRRGVTLVELIVTMAIFAIITAATAALLVPTLASYAKANELAELNSLMDTLSTELASAMTGIDQLPVLTDSNAHITLRAGPASVAYYIDDNILYRQNGTAAGQPVLQPRYYKRKQLAVVFAYTAEPAATGTVIQTTLTLTLSDGGTMDRTFATKPMLLNQ